MPSLLLIIFLIQLAIHVVNSVGAPAVSELAWHLYNYIPSPVSARTRLAKSQHIELLRLKREMLAVSPQDDFARWAKLRRQHDKVSDEHNKTSTSVSSSKTQFTTIMHSVRWLVTNGLRLFLQLWYARAPLFWIPRGWLPGSVEWLLCWPRAPTGSVSVQMWSMACTSVIALVGEVFVAVWMLAKGP